MFSNLAPYPAIRPVCLPWLDTIPDTWRLARAKEVLSPIDVRSRAGHEELLTVSSHRGVVSRSSETVTMFQAVSYAGHKLCWPGDLVINSLWAWGRGLGVSSKHGIVSTAYGVYRPRPQAGLDARYLHELVRSDPFNWELTYRSRGVWKSRLQLTDDRFLTAPMPIPPADEQAAIVKYLGHAHVRIDRAIAAKCKLIALLEEQKQAIIHQAVTRGLDPSVPLKDSGVPWLGEIPAHWSVARLKDLAEVQTGLTLGKDYGAAQTSEYNYLRVANVQSSSLDLREVTRVRVPASEAERCTLRTGDVLMTEGGDIDKLGRSTIWTGEIEPCLHQNHVFAVRCHEVLDPLYLVLMMSTPHGRQYFYTTAKKTTNLASTNSTTLRAFGFHYPAVDEQRRIVAWLEENTAGVVGVQSRAKREIDLLREFRTRLTSDVVTGQVDVREIAATLPELTDDMLANTGDDAVDTELEDVEDFTEGEDD